MLGMWLLYSVRNLINLSRSMSDAVTYVTRSIAVTSRIKFIYLLRRIKNAIPHVFCLI